MKKKFPGPVLSSSVFLDCSLQFQIGRMNVIGKDDTRNIALIRTRYNGWIQKKGTVQLSSPRPFQNENSQWRNTTREVVVHPLKSIGRRSSHIRLRVKKYGCELKN